MGVIIHCVEGEPLVSVINWPELPVIVQVPSTVVTEEAAKLKVRAVAAAAVKL